MISSIVQAVGIIVVSLGIGWIYPPAGTESSDDVQVFTDALNVPASLRFLSCSMAVMIKAMQALGHPITDDNEADALALLHWSLETHA